MIVPDFTDNVAIMPIFDVLDWLLASQKSAPSGEHYLSSKIFLPALQRGGVWRPKQVLELWDTLLRGLPIGMFQLVEARKGDRAVTIEGKLIDRDAGGFDLLDGQQRLRALMVGVQPDHSEQRNLWIDLSEDAERLWPCLYVTSRAQPFGYKPLEGSKWSLNERREARKAVEGDASETPLEIVGANRRAYDSELFCGAVLQRGGGGFRQPPLPFRSSPDRTFKLNDLVVAWRGENLLPDSDEGLSRLRHATGIESHSTRLDLLDVALRKAAAVTIPLYLVRVGADEMAVLFERIGAGGTPLQGDERLYSVLKSHIPDVRRVVDEVHDLVGRILTPSRIAATALRLATTMTDSAKLDGPDVFQLKKLLQNEDFKAKLRQLILIEDKGKSIPVVDSFKRISRLLRYSQDAGNFWLPDALLPDLPVELWEVLVFWDHCHPPGTEAALGREQVVRLALFWVLCVTSKLRASRLAFEYLSKRDNASPSIDRALYTLFTHDPGGRCAYSLPDHIFKIPTAGTMIWLTHAERFGVGDDYDHLGAHWWWNGKKLLPWIQREYVRDAFPGYAALAEHEDDLPYDFDHICPVDDWNTLRGARLETLTATEQKKIWNARSLIGDGIGNLRIIDSSENRSLGKMSILEKIPSLSSSQRSDEQADELSKWALSPDQTDCNDWCKADASSTASSGAESRAKWDLDRISALQRAVEGRAAFLYRLFFDGLEMKQMVKPDRDQF